jgi:inosine-uridine nucleoside N-ribohydrolase
MRLIYCNDASSDDLMALLYLLTHPNINIEAITIPGTGEAHGINGAKNISDFLYMLGVSNIPIAYGSESPCGPSGKPFPDWLRKIIDNLLVGKNIPQNPSPNITHSAVSLIKHIVESKDEKITILVTGPLTNIAEFIQNHPDLKNKIEKIIFMGGAINVPGNIQALDKSSSNTVAEWNIYADPKAANIVFSSGIPITLVPLNATNQIPMTREFYTALSVHPHPAVNLLYKSFKAIVDSYGEEEFFKEYYLWDPLAAMICANSALSITKRISINIDVESGQTKQVDENHKNASMIDVALEIPNPELILGKLINELRTNLINFKPKATSMHGFHQTQINKTETIAQYSQNNSTLSFG